MGYPEFRDPDAPSSFDEEFKLWDKPLDELSCPRCFSPMKSWDKKCKTCGYVEGEEELDETSDEDDVSDDPVSDTEELDEVEPAS